MQHVRTLRLRCLTHAECTKSVANILLSVDVPGLCSGLQLRFRVRCGVVC